MKFKITRKSLMYDIANQAYIIASVYEDMEKDVAYARITDICEPGNRDRVARVLGLAYSRLADLLFPAMEIRVPGLEHDCSKNIHDYEFIFSREGPGSKLTMQKKLKIKETVREFMVCMVLADWMGSVMPVGADIWKERAEECISALTTAVFSINGGFRRRVEPM